jgi:serine/threonine-protein kinase
LAVKPGDILCDKFRIDALIGRGGMGQVFSATVLDSTARTQVAIKVVSRLLVDDVLMARLHREAEAAQRIHSDFVPRVFEVNDTQDGETFLVMERLVGDPLSQRIRDQGALSWAEVIRIGDDVLRGLIDAHAVGIVHRDLKPSNVFLARKNGRVRAMVLDFGVCKMDGIDAERLTGTGESIGTVAYMAPEQIRGAARVDERADLFAFGVLVFEMLSGRLPHDGPSQMAILASKLENAPAQLRDCSRVAIPAGADELVARTLARDPADRFADAAELLRAWRALAKSDTMLAASSSRPPRAPAPNDDSTVGREAPTEISRPVMAAFSANSLSDSQSVSRSVSIGPPRPPPMFASLPPDPNPTQTSLTTHSAAMRRTIGGPRIAMLLASCGLIVGIVVVGVSISRGADPARASSSSEPVQTGVAAVTTAAVSDVPGASTADPSGEPPAASANAVSFELPADPAPPEPTPAPAAPGMRSRPAPVRVIRPSRPAPAPAPQPAPQPPAPKTSGPHITPLPRY